MANESEKIAIIGMGCRLPPNAHSPAAFWRFLLRGGNALRPIKKDRWDWRQYFDGDQRRPGKTYAPKAASLDADYTQFDPLAFGMSPREAASLDPQQRFMLEVTWEAFEDAGIPLEKLAGSATGVFVGGFCLDHLLLNAQPSNRALVNAHSAGGVMMTVLSNRISHAFDLRGPSVTLDTACSSSLVSLHFACQSLRNRECALALAGGVSVMTRPEFPIIMSKGHFLSDHGECHTFDESASGYARGEGAGILVLKRLADALADGDQVHAVIAASGVNQDGHTDGIALPNSEAQEALVREVYRRAGVAPGEVDYVEAHGTGTQAGDSAELRALDRNFSVGRTRPLIVGSVKTNIGHLEAVAGVAGVIKTVGVLKARQAPKNLHFKKPNPKIPFGDYRIEIPRDTTSLPPASEKPTLYAGVNSFGYGGTNAHVVLESAPDPAPVAAPKPITGSRLIPISAGSEEALRDLAGKFAFQLGQNAGGTLEDFAHTAAFRRSHLAVRAGILAGDLETLRERLIALSTGEPHEAVAVTEKGAPAAKKGVVFVYTGMGPQWWGMGQELIRSEPIVAAAIDEVDAHFAPLAGWSLKAAMLAPESESRMARTELAQPANFALQIALTRLWASHGVHPAAVVGHSVGEVASAYVAGVYTLEEAVRVSFHRSQSQQSVAGRGAMLAVGLAEAEALREIAGSPGVSIAAVNSFSAVTLSGDVDQLKAIAAALEARGVFQKFLRVEVAYHSPQMDPLREGLLAALATLVPKPATLPLYSTAHGEIVPGDRWDAEYWWHNVRESVRFADAIRHLLDDGFTAFLEVGPHPVLGNSIKECAATLGRRVTGFASLRRAEPERPRFLRTLAELYAAGVNPDWTALAPTPGRFLPGPQYPWQRQAHWVESDRSRMERLGLPGPVYLNRTVLAPRPTWEVEVNRNYFPFLFDHGVQDQVVFAGLGYIEAALALSRQVHGPSAIVLENVSFERVLVVDYSKIQILVTEFDSEEGRFNISSRVEGESEIGQRQCRGRMIPQVHAEPPRLDLAARRAECPTPVSVEAFYDDLRDRGLHYGPAFRPTAEIFVGEDCFFLRIDAGVVCDEADHPLHPTIFDAAIQPVLFCAKQARLVVPFSFEEFHYFSRPEAADCFAFGRIVSQSESRLVADVWLTDAEGTVLACVHRMALQAIDIAPKADGDLFYEPEWKPTSRRGESADADGRRVLILAAAEGAADAKAILELLPGAEISAAEKDFSEVVAAHPGRDRLVVLWGTSEVPAAEALGEKAVALFQALGVARREFEVTLVTRGARSIADDEPIANLAASPLGAIGMVAQNEFDAVRGRSIDFAGPAGAEAALIRDELASGAFGDVVYRAGERFESVLSPRRKAPAANRVVSTSLDEPLELRSVGKGRIDSLRFEATPRVEPRNGEIELRVHRAALNHKDLLKIEGRLPAVALEDTFWGPDLGMEAAGVVTRCGPDSGFAIGDRVVGLFPRAFRTCATVPAGLAVKIPDALDFNAAAIPVAYLAAWRGLIDVANLQPGERVLIHQAMGGAGQAAVAVARWIGAEIFATAGTEEKRRALREMGIERVFSSRDLDFGRQIREATDREGVDVVIGALDGPARHVGLSVLRSGGRYVELGKKDIAEDLELPLRPFNRNLTFASVDIDRLALERPEIVRKSLEKIFTLFELGELAPPAVRVVPAAEVAGAFREMAAGGHAGKLVLDFSAGEVDCTETPRTGPIVRSDGAYIVTGGTAGFGLATGRWLVGQGAGSVFLVSRSGPRATGIAEAVAEMTAGGARVEALAVDVTDPVQVRELFARVDAGPHSLKGVVHAAMVLGDAMMTDVTPEGFRRVFAPKAGGAMHLADALEGRGNLDFVVFYSSISALIGNRGQASYVAANALLDALAHDLRARGFPAISINWGALAESGVVARDERLGAILSTAGITGLGDREAFDALARAIRLARPQLGIFKVDWSKWIEAHPKLAGDVRFRGLGDAAGGGAEGDVAAQVRAALADATPEERLAALVGHLQATLAETLKMAPDAVSTHQRLNEMGVDSLLVLELSLGIQERIGVSFSAMEFLKGPTLEQLAALAQDKLWPAGRGA